MQRYRNIHAGTCLLVGNGNNLHLTPPAWFGYPSFGMNTIHKYSGWKPDYYIAVDTRVMNEFGKEIAEKYRDTPKFITTDLAGWQGDNFVTFNHLPADLKNGWKPERLDEGMTYHSSMHVAMQLAYFMGFTTLLMIGIEHKPDNLAHHFWGLDEKMNTHVIPVQDWLTGYRILVQGMKEKGVEVLNISADTFVPEDILPRDDWRKYAKS